MANNGTISPSQTTHEEPSSPEEGCAADEDEDTGRDEETPDEDTEAALSERKRDIECRLRSTVDIGEERSWVERT